MGRAVVLESFGGPEVLEVREVEEPHAGPGWVRVRVAAAGLNPMDWIITADEQIASVFGLSLPTGFGCDYAGVVDEVGDGVSWLAVGDRVYGGALEHAATGVTDNRECTSGEGAAAAFTVRLCGR